MEAYLCLTWHYATEKDTLNTILLGVEHFPQSHAADNLAQAEDKIMEAWRIKSKVKCMVTDAAPNMIACARTL